MYYLYNGHGDVMNLVDTAGVIKNTYDYDIYGKEKKAIENGTTDPVRYAGEYYDSESGMYYLRARYYDPEIARFISEDTYKGNNNDPLSLNLYTYCLNNPIMYHDPDGHNPKVINNTCDGAGPASSISLPRSSTGSTAASSGGGAPTGGPYANEKEDSYISKAGSNSNGASAKGTVNSVGKLTG